MKHRPVTAGAEQRGGTNPPLMTKKPDFTPPGQQGERLRPECRAYGCQRVVFDSDSPDLRDYFAAAALPGVIAARTALSVAGVSEDINQESIAEECYEIADAMLFERKKPRSEEE